jgi:hypothetical protein
MLSISGFTGGAAWEDANVLNADFRDPGITPFNGDDSNGFDPVNVALGYFAGHGSCNDQTSTACTNTAGCPNIAGLTKVCTRFTNSPLAGRCMYSRPRVAVIDDSSTSGCESINLSTADVRFGDSPTSTGFAGAGVNGNLNSAVMSISCGVTPNMYIPQYAGAFAGTNLIHTIMATRQGSDTVDVTGRGQAFADRYVANTLSSVGTSWTSAINSISGGGSCAFGGGGHGITGCGAHVSMSHADDFATANWNLTSYSWVQARNEGFDQTSGGWMTLVTTCNYDCNANPWTL